MAEKAAGSACAVAAARGPVDRNSTMEIAVSNPVTGIKLSASAVLSEAWRLYKRLFARSVLMGAIVFGIVQLLDALAVAEHNVLLLNLVTVLLTMTGLALLQGGLVEIVRGLHVDGNDRVSVAQAFRRASSKLSKLIRVAVYTGLGVGLGTLLFVVPGQVLWTRWAVGVPVAMLEDGSPSDALRRSNAIVKGNGWNVFTVLFLCGVLEIPIALPLLLVATHTGPFGRWIALTLAFALTAPFLAHALIVVYYALVEPGRPVVLAAGSQWQSVWDVQAELERPTTAPKTEVIEDDYARKFDKRAKQ